MNGIPAETRQPAQGKNLRPRKPCPDLPKGQRCHLCGGEFICLQSWRKKPRNAGTSNNR